MNHVHQAKWQHQATILERTGLALTESGASVVVASDLPHFISLQLDDEFASGVTFFYLRKDETSVGSGQFLHIIPISMGRYGE